MKEKENYGEMWYIINTINAFPTFFVVMLEIAPPFGKG
jgi:hypothetical protein